MLYRYWRYDIHLCQSDLFFSFVMTSTAFRIRFNVSLICLALVAATITKKQITTTYTCESTSEVARHTQAPQVMSVNQRTMNDVNAINVGTRYLV